MDKQAYIITGVSSGLGAELAKLLLAEGNQVIGISRSVNKDIQQHADDFGYPYRFVAADLSRVENVEVLLQEILASIASPHITSITLINNAATVTPIKPIQACSQDEVMASIQLNLAGPMILTSSFINTTMKWTATRTIVNISSGSALYPASSMSLYCSTKAALNMFTKCVELEQAAEPNPVRMLAIDPGMMNTGMQQTARETDFELSTYFNMQKDKGKLLEPGAVARDIIAQITG